MTPAEKPAMRGHDGLSESVQLGGNEHSEHSLSSPLPQLRSRLEIVTRATEYRLAAKRNAAASRELGGRHGASLMRLAEHFSRRAAVLDVQAGGMV